MAIQKRNSKMGERRKKFHDESEIANHKLTVTVINDSSNLQPPARSIPQSNVSTNETLEDLEARIFANIDDLKNKSSK
ncbi:hypothetical protein MXB_3318 [Myxobolus squamalis]|nr:hypothetical protein MXB_3318 [Myxobolus squamalis]